jgi:hypothetical protein
MKTREADEALCLGFDDTSVAEAVALPVGVHVGDPTLDGGDAGIRTGVPVLHHPRGARRWRQTGGVTGSEPTEAEPGGPQTVRSPGIHVGHLR